MLGTEMQPALKAQGCHEQAVSPRQTRAPAGREASQLFKTKLGHLPLGAAHAGVSMNDVTGFADTIWWMGDTACGWGSFLELV